MSSPNLKRLAIFRIFFYLCFGYLRANNTFGSRKFLFHPVTFPPNAQANARCHLNDKNFVALLADQILVVYKVS